MATSKIAANPATQPTFFASPAEFRAWLKRNHASAGELLVGFHKKHTEKPTMTWPESVDQALAFGWIDGIRRSLGAEAYTIRFTPRRKGSVWSTINIARVAELTRQKLMTPSGLAAFADRKEHRSGIYAYEQRSSVMPEEFAKVFRRDKAAWKFFQSRPPGYRKTAMWYIVSAKKDETRQKRLRIVMDYSARGKQIPGLDRSKK